MSSERIIENDIDESGSADTLIAGQVSEKALLSTGIRVGTLVKTKDMSSFISRTRPDGLHVIDTGKTLSRIETAGRLLSRLSPKGIVAYSSRDYIPLFHGWIQEKIIPDHLLIDVADYSHIPDGPGIMLIAHEGHFSLDQEKIMIGGWIYFHNSKAEHSYLGGKVIEVRETDFNGSPRIQFGFQAMDEAKGVSWEGDTMRRAWHSGFLTDGTIKKIIRSKQVLKKLNNRTYLVYLEAAERALRRLEKTSPTLPSPISQLFKDVTGNIQKGVPVIKASSAV